MTYSLEFHHKALKEWQALSSPVQARLKAKLAERLESPHVAASRLSGSKNRYKIKLKKPGIRLVYEVDDKTVIVFVLAVDKRENSRVYEVAAGRVRQR